MLSHDSAPGAESNGDEFSTGRASFSGRDTPDMGFRPKAHSEDLVKDALIALTKSSAPELELDTNTETGEARAAVLALPSRCTTTATSHPSARVIFEYWHLFVTRVDPLAKILHCPTFVKNLLDAIDNPDGQSLGMHALVLSVCYAAVSTCTDNETRRRFGESKEALLQKYSRVVEGTIANNYGLPTLESVQALVLYLFCIRREEDTANVRALFGLAVRLAQMIGLHDEPDPSMPPFEAEYRRRLWWHLCGAESRAAEEGGARSTSIMQGRNRRFPLNFNDDDLDPRMEKMPAPRIGVADTTFVIVRWEIFNLVFLLWAIRKESGEAASIKDIQEKQNRAYNETKARLQKEHLSHFDASRPFDWLCAGFIEAMMMKV
jgi:hypothetical protein